MISPVTLALYICIRGTKCKERLEDYTNNQRNCNTTKIYAKLRISRWQVICDRDVRSYFTGIPWSGVAPGYSPLPTSRYPRTHRKPLAASDPFSVFISVFFFGPQSLLFRCRYAPALLSSDCTAPALDWLRTRMQRSKCMVHSVMFCFCCYLWLLSSDSIVSMPIPLLKLSLHGLIVRFK